MTIDKMKHRLEVAYELIANIHSDLCRTTTRDNDIVQDTMEILRLILLLDMKLNKMKKTKGGE